MILQSAVASVPDSLSYDVQHFTSENGLPQNSVKAIAADKDGFVWLTTEGGLVRFDGRDFSVYNKSNTAISSNRMLYMIRGLKTGNLYALTERNRLLLINKSAVSPLSKYNKRNSSFSISPDSSLLAYRSIGLPNIFSGDIFQETALQLSLNPHSSFVVTLDTVRFYVEEKELWKTPYRHKDYWNFFTIHKQLYYLNGDGIFTLIQKDSLKNFRLSGDILHNPAYAENVQPEIYWNNTSGNVFLYLNQCFYLLEHLGTGMLSTRLILSGFDFKLNSIYSVCYDRVNRRLFLGSQTRGLFVINRKYFRTLTAGKVNGGDENYYAQTVYQGNMSLTAKGNILGLSGSESKAPLMERYGNRYSLLTDRQGNIWKQKSQTVYKLSPGGQRLLKQFILPDIVTQLYQDRSGRIWIGMVKSGLYRLNPSGNAAKPEPVISLMSEVSYMMQETEDLLWIGTKSGLYRLNIPEGKVDTIAGLESIYIRNIHIVRPNEIWIATAENGLYLYKDKTLTAFPLDKGGYLASSHCILEDDEGYFWISTNRGLFRTAKNDLLAYAGKKLDDVFYMYYGKDAGFNTNEFNGGCQPCGIKLENGYFSLPSLHGLVWFKPGQVRAELPVGEIFIDKIIIDSTRIEAKDTLKLHSPFNRLQVFFTIPYFGNPYNLNIKYSLKGRAGAAGWLSVNQSNIISYSSLPSGTYQLTIRKINGFGDSNYSDKTLVIIIPPAFYETWWFLAGVIMAALSAIFLYMRFRLNNIRRKNDKLEKRIADRTVKLRQTIIAQQASEESLRQQNYLQQRLLAAITHDIKSPLHFLVMSVKNIHGNLQQYGNDEAAEDMEKIYESSYRLFHFTENLVQYMKVNMAGKQLDNEAVNLHGLINEKVEVFSEVALSRGNNIRNKVDTQVSLRTNKQLLGIIIHNLLDNAVKFTREGCIIFSNITAGDQILIILEDTGKGMPEEMINWCNNFSAWQLKQSFSANNRHGLGLTIVGELLAMIDGKLAVKRRPDKGTEIKLAFKQIDHKPGISL